MGEKRWCLAAFLALLFSSPSLAADSPVTVHFAGFAMSGAFDKTRQSFPYTDALLTSEGANAQTVLNQSLVQKIASQTFENLSITTELGDYKKGDSLVLAFVLTWENVDTERFEDFTKIAINLQAEALLFDYNTKQIVAAYPFGVEYIDSTSGTLDPLRVQTDIRNLYEGKVGGLLDEFANALHRISPKASFGGRIQIVSTTIAQPAAETLSQNNVDALQARELLQNSFERYLSRNGDVPVLPHASDQAIGGVMAARFANGDIFTLQIPSPDYQITLNLNNLRKVEVSRTDAEAAYAYASYLDVKVSLTLSQRTYLDASFKYATVKVISNSGAPDDASAFQ